MSILKEEIYQGESTTLLPGRNSLLSAGNTSNDSTSSIMNKTKIEFKLKEYDGTSNGCVLWFWELEKALMKM
jgi:hypothetical protein